MKRGAFANHSTAAPRGRYVYGVHPVAEWLRWGPTHVYRVLYAHSAARRLAPLAQLAGAANVPATAASEEGLRALAGTTHHQGVVAEMAPFPYARLEDVVARQPRLCVIADQMQDPRNLGALLRVAEAVGVGAVILPRDGAVAVTPAVEAAAAGAAAVIPVCRVTNMVRTLGGLRASGYWSAALIAGRGTNLYAFEAPERLVIVVGGEQGVRALVAKQCDFVVSIPMWGKIDSLNASVAAAVALYELVRRSRAVP